MVNKFADAISRLHSHGETEVGDDYDIPSIQNTLSRGTIVPNLDNNDPEYKD